MPESSPAILLIAYGSCTARGLASLKRFEERVRLRYPGLPVRWAYTSSHIRTRLACQARLKSDSVTKALKRLVLERFGPIVAQPLQIVPASENAEVEVLAGTVASETGTVIKVGAPLLASENDLADCRDAVFSLLPQQRQRGEDVVLMGHGTMHAAQKQYDRLSRLLTLLDPCIHLATMSGDVTLANILPELRSHKVWLLPFLGVVGKHTVSDMAGAHPESWKSKIEAAGHVCEPVIAGVLESVQFVDIWMKHLDQLMAGLGVSPVCS